MSRCFWAMRRASRFASHLTKLITDFQGDRMAAMFHTQCLRLSLSTPYLIEITGSPIRIRAFGNPGNFWKSLEIFGK